MILRGSELAGFIKERQAKAVRQLKQTAKIQPKLAIIQAIDDPVIDTYVRLKKRYGEDIGIAVDIHKIPVGELMPTIKRLNDDETVTAIIVQLPLPEGADTDAAVNAVKPAKDVDGLSEKATLDPATPTAILWLIAGNNIETQGKKIAIVGRGRLVGAPLAKMLESSGHDVTICHRGTPDMPEILQESDIIITATGVPGLITSDMVKVGAVVVDAGTASESGKIVGDVAEEVYDRNDIKISARKGGVGPLTVCALFENTIKSAQPH